MDVVYNIGGMQFGFKFDDDKGEDELKSFLGKLRGAAMAQVYRNEIDEHRKQIFAMEQNIAGEHIGLRELMIRYDTKKHEFKQLGGHGEYEMGPPERGERDRHLTAIKTCEDNIERSNKQIKLLERLISSG